MQITSCNETPPRSAHKRGPGRSLAPSCLHILFPFIHSTSAAFSLGSFCAITLSRASFSLQVNVDALVRNPAHGRLKHIRVLVDAVPAKLIRDNKTYTHVRGHAHQQSRYYITAQQNRIPCSPPGRRILPGGPSAWRSSTTGAARTLSPGSTGSTASQSAAQS